MKKTIQNIKLKIGNLIALDTKIKNLLLKIKGENVIENNNVTGDIRSFNPTMRLSDGEIINSPECSMSQNLLDIEGLINDYVKSIEDNLEKIQDELF